MSSKDNTLKVSKAQVSQPPSVNILQSKRQIEMIQNQIINLQHEKDYSVAGAKKWQITSGVSLDWKQFEETAKIRSQLTLKDVQNHQNPVFSYIVLQQKNEQPYKVIYKWFRTPKPGKTAKNSNQPMIVEQQHIYRGEVSNYHKHGQGVYIVLQKYSDNSQKMTKINGTWSDDILDHGVLIDESGKQEVVSRNIIKLNNRSHKKIVSQEIEKNLTIEGIRKHTSRLHTFVQNDKIDSPISVRITRS